jgi:hypothetical protein
LTSEKAGAAAAKLRVRIKRIAGGFELLGHFRPLAAVRAQQLDELFAFLGELLVLAADFHFLQLAQGTQAEIEDRFGLYIRETERLHQNRLRLILVPDDADHLVDVKEGDQIAVEQVQTLLDLVEAVLEPGARPLRGGDPDRPAARPSGP